MGETMTTALSSRWPRPPLDGYTVDDLFTLPDLPPHTQLYALTGIHHDRLKTGVPFPVDIDISADALKEL
ncbi:hypothetical protein ABZ702_09945 [Streptomyces cyaneofuscatus]|uniref:hypothetical protein n=1 Tax=Streptomyces cyaneofuscatus TaxID=66883 RepID=UPI0033E7EC01